MGVLRAIGLRYVRVRRFHRDASGASAVEFAMLAAPFLAIVIVIIELAVDYLFFAQLDYAVHKAAEKFRTGAVVAENMSVDDFKSKILCPHLTSFRCADVLVNVVPISSSQYWIGGKAWSPGSVNPSEAYWCPGGSESLVLLQVAYPVPLATLIWAGQRSNANGVRYYISSNGFRGDAFGLKAPSNPGC